MGENGQENDIINVQGAAISVIRSQHGLVEAVLSVFPAVITS